MEAVVKRLGLAIFATSILTSAFLLFAVQPMFAKLVLPRLGGAPAVWAVSMCVFQALLLAGYAYSHLLGSLRSTGLSAGLHVGVLICAFVALPVGLPATLGPAPAEGAVPWLVGALVLGVGLPFFALAGNAPLLQAWFARLGHAASADPYFLYAASNAGSLGALIAYPLVIEPFLPLHQLSRAFTFGFLLLVGLIVLCGAIAARHGHAAPPQPTAGADEVGERTPRWRERATWLGLSLVPSALLVAFTTFITTDLASAPLLWVVPLALYLATFIAVFRERPLPPRPLVQGLQPLLVAMTFFAMEWTGSLSWALAAVAGLLAFVASALVCHRLLYEHRPAPRRLTEFYLWMSAGGVLGGLFSALLAPLLFTNVFEFPLLLAIATGIGAGLTGRRRMLAVVAFVAAATIVLKLAALGISKHPGVWSPDHKLLAVALLAATLALASRWPAVRLGAAAALVLAVVLLPERNQPLHVVRNFFGTHRVVASPGGTIHVLYHGTTVHGLQLMRMPPGSGARPLPLAYYHPKGPLARGLALAREIAGGARQPLRIGIVGLGTGAMACYSQPGDRWRFFEIDPAVAHIATTPRLFSYLASCLSAPDIVLGDARLTLARENRASFDYLMIDAFSSDAIPVHLLTVEALKLYADRITPDGIVALHLSNQNLDLPPIVEAGLAQLDGFGGVYAQGEGGGGALPSQVVLLSRNAAALKRAMTLPGARRLGPPTTAPWTDDHSDIVRPLIRRFRLKLGQGTPGRG
ncbi:MAG: spermidine synthase [Hyphomicrobiaceae bacterium]